MLSLSTFWPWTSFTAFLPEKYLPLGSIRGKSSCPSFPALIPSFPRQEVNLPKEQTTTQALKDYRNNDSEWKQTRDLISKQMERDWKSNWTRATEESRFEGEEQAIEMAMAIRYLGFLINNAAFYLQYCPSLDNKLYDHNKGNVMKHKEGRVVSCGRRPYTQMKE